MSSSDSVETAGSHGGSSVKPRRMKKMCVSTVHDNDILSSDIRKFTLKVPPFSPEDPEIWFALLEGQFENYGITEDHIKFNNVITNLDIPHAKAVKDIIVHPPTSNRYEKIKSELIRRLSASHEKKVKQLLTHEELGDRKPSQFLRHLMDLAGPSVPHEFIRTIWSNRLPNSIQTVLASQPTHSLEQLSDLADRIQEITTPCNVAATSTCGTSSINQSSEIAELRKMVERLALRLEDQTRTTNRSQNRSNRSRPRWRSTSRSRTRSASSYRRYPVCWYHAKFGAKASKCQKPCDYNQSGNATGSR
ncbi:uncharacterized protein LOC101746903 [Bombyx mori]|uniref:DUF7041 domain-containing protein n=1 Tax=Bombyx mori TaxID=7091 RepID=A0A8R2AI59_BOMMO|nr:uncharacterized protein LOC101746903 [Bombyx mori]